MACLSKPLPSVSAALEKHLSAAVMNETLFHGRPGHALRFNGSF